MSKRPPVRRILAIKLRALGDSVLLTAPLSELKKAYPEAALDVLVPEAWASLFDYTPGIQRVWKMKKTSGLSGKVFQFGSLGSQLRSQNYDLVLNFHASPSSAFLARLTGAQRRAIHFHGHSDENLYSTVSIPGKGQIKPIIERDMDTLRALGLSIPLGQMPQFRLTPSEILSAQNWIAESGQTGSSLLGISLGASRPTKSWPLAHFAQLALLWCQKHPHPRGVLTLVGPGERHLLKRFLLELDELLAAQVPNLSERSRIRAQVLSWEAPPLRKLAALLSQVAVLAGNDSGPKHLAIAVGTPTVTLFGPENPLEWHPYPQESHPYFFIDGLPCRQSGLPGYPEWCGLSHCQQQAHRCMTAIPVQSVFQACLNVSAKTPGLIQPHSPAAEVHP
jgi:ADP-heptose:LPS heptosyltransferase